MPVKNCRICKKEFYTKPNWLKRGWGKYCSSKCQHEDLKNGKIVPCAICNKETYKTLKALKHSKSKKYFCSKSCQTKWRNAFYVGEKHNNWKHGLFAYQSVLTRNKIPKVCTRCKTKDTRVLAVHHLDKNRKNNTLKNLIWLCNNCHFLIHHYNEERINLMRILT